MARSGLVPSLLGLGFAVAGTDKLLSQNGYRRLFRHWGWSRETMGAIGAGEMLGGLALLCPPSRRLGGLLLTAVSTAVLTAELRRGETQRALPRGALLLAAMLCAVPRRAGVARSGRGRAARA